MPALLAASQSYSVHASSFMTVTANHRLITSRTAKYTPIAVDSGGANTKGRPQTAASGLAEERPPATQCGAVLGTPTV